MGGSGMGACAFPTGCSPSLRHGPRRAADVRMPRLGRGIRSRSRPGHHGPGVRGDRHRPAACVWRRDGSDRRPETADRQGPTARMERRPSLPSLRRSLPRLCLRVRHHLRRIGVLSRLRRVRGADLHRRIRTGMRHRRVPAARRLRRSAREIRARHAEPDHKPAACRALPAAYALRHAVLDVASEHHLLALVDRPDLPVPHDGRSGMAHAAR